MLNVSDAAKLIHKEFPDGKIQSYIEYRGLYIFQVFSSDPLEGEMDPFFSVDPTTGELRDFSIITDGNTAEISSRFILAQQEKSSHV